MRVAGIVAGVASGQPFVAAACLKGLAEFVTADVLKAELTALLNRPEPDVDTAGPPPFDWTVISHTIQVAPNIDIAHLEQRLRTLATTPRPNPTPDTSARQSRPRNRIRTLGRTEASVEPEPINSAHESPLRSRPDAAKWTDSGQPDDASGRSPDNVRDGPDLEPQAM
jgi:hypothetical protein